MGIQNDAKTKGSKVVLEAKDTPIRFGQEWLRGKPNDKGWFTLKNPISGRYLKAVNPNSTIITGTYILHF